MILLLSLYGKALLGIILFLSVLLHEFGHALVARKLGYRPVNITLFALGGLARIEGNLRNSGFKEAIYSVAGPLVNFIIAGIIFIFYTIFPTLAASEILIWTFRANLILGIFNMLPIFPLDGGHILRSILSEYISFFKATYISAGIGLIFSIGLIILFASVGSIFSIIVVFFLLFLSHLEVEEARKVNEYEKFLSNLEKPDDLY